ncbi:hypothetical protein K1X84_01805 [bacterium]|nr:hypothetical protein [bacterium]
MKLWILTTFLLGSSLSAQSMGQKFYSILPKATDASIHKLIEQNGGTPIIENDTVLFLAKSLNGERPFMIADFNQWDTTRGWMLPVNGTDWFFRFDKVASDARIEYAFKYGSGEKIDEYNPKRVLSFDVETSEFKMPGFKNSRLIRYDDYRLRGTLNNDSIYSSIFKNKRAVTIYEPNGYQAGKSYPVILFKDGTPYLQRMKVHQILDSLITAKLIPPVIGLFTNPNSRRIEYMSNGDYRKYIVEELLPYFESKYKASEYSAVGSSRGGLATADLVLNHSDIFSKCVAISPAFRPVEIADQWIKLKPKFKKVIVIESRYDADWLPDARAWVMALRAANTPFEYWEIPQGHNQEAWMDIMDEALIRLFK